MRVIHPTLLVTDLDGTLLNNEHKISELNSKSIKRFQLDGGLITFATGRMEETTFQFIEELNINVPIISYNGARLYCPTKKKRLYLEELTISEEIWRILLNKQKEMGIFIYKNNHPFILERNAIVEEFEKKERIKCKIGSLDDFVNKPITKILLIMKAVSPTVHVPELIELEKEIQLHKAECETIFSESNYLELLPPGTSKGKGLNKLINYLGNKDIFTVAVGDNLNDISLLNKANLGIAVQNAQPELKKHADLVIEKSNNEHAIAFVIDTIILNKQKKQGMQL